MHFSRLTRSGARSARLASLLLLLLLAVLVLLGPPGAQALPVSVSVRVEGSAKTLFEGQVMTEGETFETASSGGVHPCDYADNGNSGGEFTNGGSPSGTPTTALRDAALSSGLAFDAEWFGSGAKNENPGDFFVSQVGADKNESSGEFASWGYAVNYLTAPVGGCQIALAPGSEVLWAYNYFNLEHRLRLTGPASANAGTPFTVHVTDGQTGAALAGMSIGEMAGGVTSPLPGTTTDASGNATVLLAQTGQLTLKATGSGAVRSNGLAVCVHNGADGTCQTTLPPPPPGTPSLTPAQDLARIAGVLNGHVYARRSAPRLLRGVVNVPAGGTLRQVRISLQRRAGGRCFLLSGARGRFVGAHCGRTGFFSVGDSLSFSYLLPARLKPGRYVYDIEAVDASGHTTAPSNGVSHVVFRVR
jgi:hypothetical protein